MQYIAIKLSPVILRHFLQVVDLFVLLILHSTANRKKAMETLIRNKIKNGLFTEEMLSAAFNSHSQVSIMISVIKCRQLLHHPFYSKFLVLQGLGKLLEWFSINNCLS